MEGVTSDGYLKNSNALDQFKYYCIIINTFKYYCNLHGATNTKVFRFYKPELLYLRLLRFHLRVLTGMMIYATSVWDEPLNLNSPHALRC